MGFPGSSVVKNLPGNAGGTALIPRSGRSPGEGNCGLLQYSCLENHMSRGASWATVHGVTEESDLAYRLNNNHRILIKSQGFATRWEKSGKGYTQTVSVLFLMTSCESSVLVTQSCLTLWDPWDCSTSSSCVHGSVQARILEWVAISFSSGVVFPTQEQNLGLLLCRQIFYCLSHQGSPLHKSTVI